jgi:hypothetical protein
MAAGFGNEYLGIIPPSAVVKAARRLTDCRFKRCVLHTINLRRGPINIFLSLFSGNQAKTIDKFTVPV